MASKNQDLKKGIDQSDDDSGDEPENYQYKIVVLGNGTVGKTSIIMRFCEDHFARSYIRFLNNFSKFCFKINNRAFKLDKIYSYKQTIGVDFFVKRLEMPGNVHVALQVWDIGGQSIFGKMIQTYIYEANAVILVYDITNQQSFQDLDDWLNLVRQSFVGKEMPLLVLMGNKIDLNHMQAVNHLIFNYFTCEFNILFLLMNVKLVQAVKSDQHDQFAKQNGLYSFYVSAKSGDQVSSCFYRLAADLAGIEPMIEITQKQVKAEIVVQHTQNEDTEPRAEEKLEQAKKKDSKCLIF